MRTDRILDPESIAAILREYLGGVIDGDQAVVRVMRLASSTDRILAGYKTRPVVAAYWAIRRLAETGAERPDDEELSFLLGCIEGKRRFPRTDM